MSDFPIKITDVVTSQFPDVWLGTAQLPNQKASGKVMIFLRDGQYALVSALCPHLSYDMSDSNLNAEGELICARHGFVINLFAEGGAERAVGRRANKSGYVVSKQDDGFVITGLNRT
jgi:nitrite reductase/ring-hydroxylating ferredoxin subunit